MADSERHPSQPPDKSLWRVVGVTCAAALLGVFILGGFYLATRGAGIPLTVTDQDRALLVTVGDLQPQLKDFTIRTEAIQESKTRYRDKSIVLVYRYDHPGKDTRLFLLCTVTVKETVEEAKIDYRSQVEAGPEVTEQDIDFQEQKKIADWGDQYHYGSLTQNDQPWGYFLISQKDRYVFHLEIAAEGFLETSFDNFATSCLEQLDSYEPQ